MYSSTIMLIIDAITIDNTSKNSYANNEILPYVRNQVCIEFIQLSTFPPHSLITPNPAI